MVSRDVRRLLAKPFHRICSLSGVRGSICSFNCGPMSVCGSTECREGYGVALGEPCMLGLDVSDRV